MASNSNRMGRVDGELKKQISEIINYDLKNPKVNGIVSVTRVKVTPDLRYAKVYISTLDEKSIKRVLEGLEESKGYIRSEIARRVNLRITPILNFVYDDSEENGEKIDAILRKIHEEDNKNN